MMVINMKIKALSILVLASLYASPILAQNSEEAIDEVITEGTIRKDPAMSAYLSGDFATAEVEFERNAFCALRATRSFRSGIESARDSTIRADVGVDADVAPQPSGGAGGGGFVAPGAPTTAPIARLNSEDFKINDSETKRTCEDRGFQLYMAGLSELKLGKFDEAKESFTKAIRLRKTIYDAYFRLALLEYQDGDLEKARKQFHRLQKLEAQCKRCEFKKEMEEQVQYLQNILG